MAKSKKHNLQWIKQTIELKPDHRWKSSDGYKLFVAGRGAVHMEVPDDWILEPDASSFKFRDAEHPNDNCCLELSYNLYPNADFADFPLAGVLKKIAKEDSRNVIEWGEVVKVNRQTARIVWTEIKFIDSNENREAHSRTCIGLGSGVQCLITFDYWADDAEKMIPVWDNVLRSLVLGLFIRDPSTGLAFPD